MLSKNDADPAAWNPGILRNHALSAQRIGAIMDNQTWMM
jgi:hypothetical protein